MKDSILYYCIRIYKSRNNGFQCTIYKTNISKEGIAWIKLYRSRFKRGAKYNSNFLHTVSAKVSSVQAKIFYGNSIQIWITKIKHSLAYLLLIKLV